MNVYTLLCMALCVMFHVGASAQTHTIILGRPTDKSITPSIVFDANVDVYVEYGTSRGQYTNKTEPLTAKQGVPVRPLLSNLQADTRYYYRLQYKRNNAPSYTASPEYMFQTQRAQGKKFTFLVEADEHLYDKKGINQMYDICLDNQAKDSADFMFSLGDTFGDDHTPTTTTSQDMDDLHREYLVHLNRVCHSMPFFFCLGNHEGENGYYLKQNPPNNIAVWGTLWRKYYYANPVPGDFYSGNTVTEPHGMELPENYYAFTWGDALFVVLDVYRHCDVNEKPQNWDWTLGEVQYKWFKNELEKSKAKYKFVFAHHTRGQGRGAVVTAKGAEWGGYSSKGTYEFDKMRPGWGEPIHQLMVKNGVTIFFQGHDHLYAKEELDGLVYQEVPMPSDSTYTIGYEANADAYTDVTLEGTGHLRVDVGDDGVKVDFVRAWMPKDTVGGKHINGEVAYTYTAKARPTDVHDYEPRIDVQITPNPATDIINVHTPYEVAAGRTRIYDIMGNLVIDTYNEQIAVDHLARGMYTITVDVRGQQFTTTMILGQE